MRKKVFKEINFFLVGTNLFRFLNNVLLYEILVDKKNSGIGVSISNNHEHLNKIILIVFNLSNTVAFIQRCQVSVTAISNQSKNYPESELQLLHTQRNTQEPLYTH